MIDRASMQTLHGEISKAYEPGSPGPQTKPAPTVKFSSSTPTQLPPARPRLGLTRAKETKTTQTVIPFWPSPLSRFEFNGQRRRRRLAGAPSGPGLPSRVAPPVRPPAQDAARGARAGRGALRRARAPRRRARAPAHRPPRARGDLPGPHPAGRRGPPLGFFFLVRSPKPLTLARVFAFFLSLQIWRDEERWRRVEKAERAVLIGGKDLESSCYQKLVGKERPQVPLALASSVRVRFSLSRGLFHLHSDARCWVVKITFFCYRWTMPRRIQCPRLVKHAFFLFNFGVVMQNPTFSLGVPDLQFLLALCN